jgi:hypothetical protein
MSDPRAKAAGLYEQAAPVEWLASMPGWPQATCGRVRRLAAAPMPGRHTEMTWPHKSS